MNVNQKRSGTIMFYLEKQQGLSNYGQTIIRLTRHDFIYEVINEYSNK